jgi:hypothetical protein
LGALLSVLLLAAGLTVVSATTASAVGCVASTCYNKGPVSMGCTRDQRSITSPGGGLYVYYSPACQAAWAIKYTDASWDHCVYVDLERTGFPAGGVDRRLSQQVCPGEASDWTNMFPKGWYFRAVYNDVSNATPDVYTEWVFR